MRRFQSYFGLTSDGVVGRTTWNKLYEVYNDIANRLLTASLRPGEYPGVLRRGSTGTAVRELQFYLYLMSAYESSIPAVSIDGSFGAATENAVRAYQRFAKLTVDGVVGRTTWNSLYGKASILRVSGPVVTLKRLPYPGTPLAVGATGDAVLYYNLLLQRIAYYFDSVESPPLSDRYTDETAVSTRSAQALLDLPETGVADAETWTAVEALSLQLAAVSPNPDRDDRAGRCLPGPCHERGERWPGCGADRTVAQWTLYADLRRGLCDRELPLRPEGNRRCPGSTGAGGPAGNRYGERGDLGRAPCPELRMRGGMTDGTAADLRCL